MNNLERIKRSCERLPVLVETKAPACMLVSEMRMLTDRVLEAIEHALSDELHEHMACRRLLRVIESHDESGLDNPPPIDDTEGS